jgi:hypothetical protein
MRCFTARCAKRAFERTPAAHFAIRDTPLDVGYRMVPGFHLENFVDEVRDDPFAAYAVKG